MRFHPAVGDVENLGAGRSRPGFQVTYPLQDLLGLDNAIDPLTGTRVRFLLGDRRLGHYKCT